MTIRNGVSADVGGCLTLDGGSHLIDGCYLESCQGVDGGGEDAVWYEVND